MSTFDIDLWLEEFFCGDFKWWKRGSKLKGGAKRRKLVDVKRRYFNASFRLTNNFDDDDNVAVDEKDKSGRHQSGKQSKSRDI